jgi:hypothetical protein
VRRDDAGYPRTEPDKEMLLACVDLIAPQEGLSGMGKDTMKLRHITLETAVREARAHSATHKPPIPASSP